MRRRCSRCSSGRRAGRRSATEEEEDGPTVKKEDEADIVKKKTLSGKFDRDRKEVAAQVLWLASDAAASARARYRGDKDGGDKDTYKDARLQNLSSLTQPPETI